MKVKIIPANGEGLISAWIGAIPWSKIKATHIIPGDPQSTNTMHQPKLLILYED